MSIAEEGAREKKRDLVWLERERERGCEG